MERMLKFFSLAGFSALCVLLPAIPGLADSDDSHKPSPRCATKQHDEAPEGSSSLEECDGVLKPPSVGDSEMVNKPPKVETMPIIKPGDLGQQDSK
ncbi:hypothetical protein [Rhizobium leguminosarum]|uniref:hypothetical protein n=1 Tax=Rhizobium leguminosarum TaxID=384 RepID=UPI001AEA56F5|nr:hypothetical protein [Rhizobium leguminosarum]MBP2444061.1 hypothetical protein [Rhizobium leguminosarum]